MSAGAASSSSSASALHRDVPEATRSECIRFCSACGDDVDAAGEKLRAYLEWRERHGLTRGEDIGGGEKHHDGGSGRVVHGSDEMDWKWAVEKSIRFHIRCRSEEGAAVAADDDNNVTDKRRKRRMWGRRGKDKDDGGGTSSSRTATTTAASDSWMETSSSTSSSLSGTLAGGDDDAEGSAGCEGRGRNDATGDPSSPDALLRRRYPQLVFSHAVPPPSSSSSDDDEIEREGGIQKREEGAESRGKPLRDASGHRIIHHLPARIDLTPPTFSSSFSWSEKDSEEIIVTAMALYLERKLDRDDGETITLVADVRPGNDNWANVPATNLVGFMRTASRTLHDLYPGRLHNLILYPVPRPAAFLYYAIRPLLPAGIRDGIVLISGGAGRNSPPPDDQLRRYIPDGDGQLRLLERSRLRAMDDDPTTP